MGYDNYVVKEGDSWATIAFQFGMSLYNLLRINQLTEDSLVLPGMVLKVKEGQKKPAEEEKKIESPATPLQAEAQKKVHKQEVYYCTRDGDVLGILSVTDELIMFDPFIINKNYCEIISPRGKERAIALQFQACMDMRDIIKCRIYELPSINSVSVEDSKGRVFFTQFLLSRTGREKRGPRINLPKANVYFRIADLVNSTRLTYLEQKSTAEQLLALIEEKIKSLAVSDELASSTYVPYFDVNKSFKRIVEEHISSSPQEVNINPADDYEELKAEIVEINEEISKSAQQQNLDEPEFIPTLSRQSLILSQRMINQITIYLPTILQMRNWELLYSPIVHGSSLSVFYRQVEATGPSVMVIQDQNHHVFGGFVSDTWQMHHTYYGTGDCFLFTFRNSDQITCYFPTLINDYYMHSDLDALTMGSGGKAGLYVDRELMSGSSGHSETYNNSVLSSTEDFEILKLEVWGLV
ncbi:unnamed protein product [Blepharisma stoltei]|uniref:Oxidation resistance protein 1 n=1 Tax=Blepharisma stoltei TaxID=1481888 RepID=A0AAU9K2A5_9CILI|nr:unnamed protein product [Blepharisma stoltei]